MKAFIIVSLHLAIALMVLGMHFDQTIANIGATCVILWILFLWNEKHEERKNK